MKKNSTKLTEELKSTFELSQFGSLSEERKRLRVSFGPSYYQPTGRYIKAGEKVIVFLHETDQKILPRYVISPPILNDYKEATEEGTELQIGENEITAKEEGVIYFINESKPTEIPAKVTIKGANVLPSFELGKTSLAEWQEQLSTYSEAPVFELITSKALITAGMEYSDLVANPVNILEAHDEVIDIQAKVSGLSVEEETIHQPTKFRYHFRQTNQDGYYMYAYFNHTAYHKEGVPFILDVNKFKNDGWGPWHELGHAHQQKGWTPKIFVEVSVNIFSMTVQKHYGGKSRLEEEGVYEKVSEYFQTENRKFGDLGFFEQLLMLWQLRLAYGEDYYANLFKYVREIPFEEIPEEDEDKLQKFILWSSTIAKQNLIPFYKKWGIEVAEGTERTIEKLELPKLTDEIWKLRD